jgi:hypothetical protein
MLFYLCMMNQPFPAEQCSNSEMLRFITSKGSLFLRGVFIGKDLWFNYGKLCTKLSPDATPKYNEKGFWNAPSKGIKIVPVPF